MQQWAYAVYSYGIKQEQVEIINKVYLFALCNWNHFLNERVTYSLLVYLILLNIYITNIFNIYWTSTFLALTLESKDRMKKNPELMNCPNSDT